VSEPFISVVTPFHNTGKYIEECIQSVLRQSYRNFEYILVDNASSDGSRDIAERYARTDSRIRIVPTPSLLSQVQNYNFAVGLISPESRYLKIAQADDWLFPTCVAELVALAEQHPSVAVASSYELAGKEMRCLGLDPKVNVISGREACRLHMLEGIFLFGSPTTVLYRADLVRAQRPFYREHRLHEDTETVYELLRHGDFGFVHQVLSYTRMQSGSISDSTRGFHDLDRLILVKTYGPSVLSPEELDEALRLCSQRYYRSLARRWVRGLFVRQSRGFWEYQHAGLESIGEKVRWDMVAQELVGATAERLLPIELVRGLLRRRGDAARARD
jgi:glycosyltransferase involved in cell wall biosynthesis